MLLSILCCHVSKFSGVAAGRGRGRDSFSLSRFWGSEVGAFFVMLIFGAGAWLSVTAAGVELGLGDGAVAGIGLGALAGCGVEAEGEAAPDALFESPGAGDAGAED